MTDLTMAGDARIEGVFVMSGVAVVLFDAEAEQPWFRTCAQCGARVVHAIRGKAKRGQKKRYGGQGLYSAARPETPPCDLDVCFLVQGDVIGENLAKAVRADEWGPIDMWQEMGSVLCERHVCGEAV